MLENLIVGVIVVLAAVSAGRRFLPAGVRARLFGKPAGTKGDCDSGCGSCGGCEPAPPLDLDAQTSTSGQRDDGGQPSPPAARRVITLHPVPLR